MAAAASEAQATNAARAVVGRPPEMKAWNRLVFFILWYLGNIEQRSGNDRGAGEMESMQKIQQILNGGLGQLRLPATAPAPYRLASRITFPLRLASPRAIAEAISSAGGVK